MRWPWRRRGAPQPPENVRLVFPDGREVPVECVYEGLHEGAHHWVSAWPVDLSVPHGVVITLLVGVLPARTAIRLVVSER